MQTEFSPQDNAHSVADSARQAWCKHSTDEHACDALIGKIQHLPGFRHCLLLCAPDAPGLLIAAGTLRAGGEIVSFTGAGESIAQALTSALGEAVEILALEIAATTSAPPPANHCPPLDIGWMKTIRSISDTQSHEVLCKPYGGNWPATVPACILSSTDLPHNSTPAMPPVSAGAGSGVDLLDAIEHGLLELIEHDAIAHWWFGQRQATPIDLTGHSQASAFLTRIRGELADQRKTCLFELSAATGGCSVVGAASFDIQGQGFSCGTAARASTDLAAVAALREMAQIEFGHHCVRARLTSLGLSELSYTDRNYIRRSQIITRERFLSVLTSGNCNTAPRSRPTTPANLNTPLWLVQPPDRLAGIVACKVIAPLLSPLSADLYAAEHSDTDLTASHFQRFEQLLP